MDNDKDFVTESTSYSSKEKVEISINEDVTEHIDDNTKDNPLSDIVEPPLSETSKLLIIIK